ncbi:tumor necrosis factor, alpha-induced protein 8-like protein 2 B [Carcharodon carcharias]|uniref:tumor necrosis factor, alpha-induced protein 8-like protein 2 B n=1 Tax=Carcharodon carcharias TaxID=13397 RepID=UPI001B7D97FD|nr:tumor necrosis factor, alpha-induced protein 8-like protein 2 B [Carcharodon carcharias]XP_041037727.1 tumor necrosis factor, alpha-induced protein 8-like protein 2 B [Carcharodon carcharias]XP_041037728.1 tumor necrosis factor, alpha-induced protein 8-like protein 2 B [Carcharodon carcharias]XP_041037729.1 tumor necrosis factor, alpha-induced protein 8-like protein 2 B [Carcharodon carcharias]
MESFSSKDLAMKAQKKILSRMASKTLAQLFIDDTSAEILDELYRVSKEFTGNKAESQKVLKNLVKVAVKIGVLYRHQKFSEQELGLAEDFRKKLRQGAMTAVSFREVAFTFEHSVLVGLLHESRDLLLRLVRGHLTPKSHGRISHVFDHFANVDLLTKLYGPEGPYQAHLQKICEGLNKLIEEGTL